MSSFQILDVRRTCLNNIFFFFWLIFGLNFVQNLSHFDLNQSK
jgi:hypothetical protein